MKLEMFNQAQYNPRARARFVLAIIISCKHPRYLSNTNENSIPLQSPSRSLASCFLLRVEFVDSQLHRTLPNTSCQTHLMESKAYHSSLETRVRSPSQFETLSSSGGSATHVLKLVNGLGSAPRAEPRRCTHGKSLIHSSVSTQL